MSLYYENGLEIRRSGRDRGHGEGRPRVHGPKEAVYRWSAAFTPSGWLVGHGSLLLVTFLLLSSCSGGHAGAELVVSAAASLDEPLRQVSAAFRQHHPEVKVILNLGGSGSLARQVERGAPVDVVIFASRREMDVLERQGLIDVRSGRDLLANRLVLVVPARSAATIAGWEDLAGVNRMAIALPEVAPLGQYSREVLQHLGLWDRLMARVVPARDALHVVSLVRTGNVDAAILYSTSARHPEIRVVAEAPPGSHQPVVYPAAAVSSSHEPEWARAFLDFLFEEEAEAIFRASGFDIAGGR